jgi:manganese/zinc/iron transport system substrate-binding protein
MRGIEIFGIVIALAFATQSCSRGDDKSAERRATEVSQRKASSQVKVTATIGMIGDLAQIIGAKDIQVTTLMGPGTDPHLYKAREKDIRLLAEADLVLYNGLHLEGKLGAILEKMARKKQVVPVAEVIPKNLLIQSDNGTGARDPHVWFDVSLWSKVAERIRDVLIEAAPDKKAGLSSRAADLLKQLSTLDTWVKDQTASIADESRVLITAHDAFGYFGKAYGMEVRGIQGISTEDEAGVRDINQLVDFIAEKKIKAVFVESTISKKNIQALIEGCAAKGHTLSIGGELFSDAMGEKGTRDGTYIGMVEHNVKTIVNALK